VPIAVSSHRFQELCHVEEQIKSMSVMPDFGYLSDNYILEKDETQKRNWELLSCLLHNKDRFTWLLNFIKLQKMREERENTLKDTQKDKMANSEN